MGSGQLLTPLETQSLWTIATVPTPTAQDLGKGDRKYTKAPEAPATDQGLHGEGRERGEILEVPLSPAKTPGPLPRGVPTVLSQPQPQPRREPGTFLFPAASKNSSENAKLCC